MNDIFIMLLYVIVGVIIAVLAKAWKSLDIYFEKKAEGLATKQDISEITVKTEEVQAEFHKILERFDADLKFKYQFYEEQYKELYSELFQKICRSEALRFILDSLEGTHLDSNNIPIVEYESENDEVNQEMIKLIQEKHIYASPGLLGLACKMERIEDYTDSVDTEDKAKELECELKRNMVKVIIKDYRWLRQQLQLQKESDIIGCAL